MSLISQNILNEYSVLDEYDEMSFLFGDFANAHRGESLFVFNAFYTALQNGEVNCYHEQCDHSACPVWDYFNEWFIIPMIEEIRNNHNNNQVQEMVRVLRQSYTPELIQRVSIDRSGKEFLRVFRGFEQALGAQRALEIFIDCQLIRYL